MNFHIEGNQFFREGDYLSAWNCYTKGLAQTPQNPVLWSNRSLTDMKLNVFELGYIDALKAYNLLKDQHTNDQNLQLLFIKTIDRMSESLSKFGVFPRAITILDSFLDNPLYNNILSMQLRQQLLRKKDDYQIQLNSKLALNTMFIFESLNHVPNTNEIIKRIMDMGMTNFNYPWDRERLESRGNELNIGKLQRELDIISSKSVTISLLNPNKQNTSCETFTTQLGIFAKEEISEGTVALNEDPFLTVHGYTSPRCSHCARYLKDSNFKDFKIDQDNNLSTLNCQNNKNCTEIFCNKQCFDLAMTQYHPALCGKNLQPFLHILHQHKSGKGDSNPLFLLKIFAYAKMRNISPLDIQEIKYLAQYRPSSIGITNDKKMEAYLPSIYFDFYFSTLELLEISPYDIQYDFWIYITIMCKLQVNSFGRDGLACLYKFMSFINHSCVPNAYTDPYVSMQYTGGKDESSDEEIKENNINLVSLRKIQKGEQIFISYCNETLNKEDRAIHLIPAYGFECTCEKCRNEDPQDLCHVYLLPIWWLDCFRE
ncbi:2701_t:CDS:1 [Cetraspora pellucida]|uniref:Histone-lysine N-methyltransferase SET5 n=1 Tax=Cetraspora pellucida TaxID=1433469 RepID=A0A9N8Z5Z7_9GLOM|nr:2701_t:CDS:1 [Cetraspora pellucida]